MRLRDGMKLEARSRPGASASSASPAPRPLRHRQSDAVPLERAPASPHFEHGLMLPPVPGSPMRAPSMPQYAVLRLRLIDGLTLAAAFRLATYAHLPDGYLDAPLISEASLVRQESQ